MIELAAQLVPLKLNAEKEGKELAEKYKVDGFPTILFVDATGELFGEIGGYMPPAGFSSEMAKTIALYKAIPAIEGKLKSNPLDGEANARYAAVMAARRKVADAERHLANAEKAKYSGPYLSKAYNAVGDYYQMDEKFDRAIELFRKGDSAAKDPADRSYSKVSMMYCYLGKMDVENAKKIAKEIVAMKDAVKEHVEMAKEVLDG